MVRQPRSEQPAPNTHRRKPVFLLTLGLTMLVFGAATCGRGPSPVKRPGVRIGYVPIAVALPLFVAVDNGYFAERGVDVELVRINTSNDLGTAGTLGRVDFMMPCALNVIFDIANVSGVRHRLFGLNVYSDKPPNVADYLLVRKDSPVHTIRELRGKRIAGHPGSATQIVIKLIMEKESIPADGYAFVPLQPAEWGPALSSGAIDAVAALEPEASQLMVSGIARSIVDGFYAKLMPDLPLSGWWVSAGYTERSGTSQVIQAVIDGYRRAVAYIETNPDSAKLHFKNYVPIREDALPRMQLNKWLTPETIDLATVQHMVDLFAANRVIQARVSVDSFLVR